MTRGLKRPPASCSRSVSPPAVKRKIQASDTVSGNVDQSFSSPIRIYSWNVNGVGPFLQKSLSFEPAAQYPLRQFLSRHEWPTFLCLQEVKISLKDDLTQHRLRLAANAGSKPHEPTYVTHFSLPRDKYNATGFGGKVHGVATLIRADFALYVNLTRKPVWDLEGRVLIHECTNDLVVINGYWVNGTSNPYRNPDSGITEGNRHDHKLRFHKHMLEEALNLRRQGRHVILVGDMNVARGRIDGYPNLRVSPEQHVLNRSDFNGKFFTDETGMRAVDVFREIHGQRRKYTYFSRSCDWGQSCDRVDLIISTAELFGTGAVTACDICDNPRDRGHSDHVPLWVELDLHKLTSTTAGPIIRDSKANQLKDEPSKVSASP